MHEANENFEDEKIRGRDYEIYSNNNKILILRNVIFYIVK